MVTSKLSRFALLVSVVGCAPPLHDAVGTPAAQVVDEIPVASPMAYGAAASHPDHVSIWRRASTVRDNEETPCGLGEPTPTLEVDDLWIDGSDLLISVVYSGTSTEAPEGREAAPDIEARVGGCPTRAIAPVSGTIRAARGGAASTVAVPVASLPEGELVVSVIAHGLSANFQVERRADRLRPIEEADLATARVVRDERASGAETVLSRLVLACPEGGSR